MKKSDLNFFYKELIETFVPILKRKFFAYGDLCVAAIHYKGFFEGMTHCSFAALRKDYDAMLPLIESVCFNHGLIFEKYSYTNGAVNLYSRVGKRIDDVNVVWINFLPLDNIPNQVILRFKLFKEARKNLPAASNSKLEEIKKQLCRYNSYSLPFCACLAFDSGQKQMGERTIFQRSILKEDLFPLRYVQFENIEIPVSKKVSNWTLEMTPQRKKDIEIIQRESLLSLVDLDKACEKMGANYFLVGGSMLGAVRHQGFIPWDDDTDVGFLRKDYKLFCKNAQKLMAEKYFLQLPKTDKHIHFVYARLRRAGVNYITHYNENKNFNKGIWVDLFPFDAIPANKYLANFQKKWANMFARASMGLKRRREYVLADIKDGSPIACPKDAFYLRLYRFASILFPVRLCDMCYQAIARMFNPLLAKKQNTVFASFIPSYTTITKDEAFPVRKVLYEGKPLAIPNHAEEFLVRQYGDFDKIPPLHERYAEHGFKRLEYND